LKEGAYGQVNTIQHGALYNSYSTHKPQDMKQESAENRRSKQTAPGVPIVLPKMGSYAYEDEYHNEVARLIWANLSTRRKGHCNKLAVK
jgi:hypothetical protein